MSTDVWDQVAAALEAGYDDEPAPREPGGYVAAGRRRLRNRRLRLGAAGAVLAAAAVTVALLPDGAAPRSTPDPTPVVQQPTPTATEAEPTAPTEPTEPAEKVSDVLVPGQQVGYDGHGNVVLRRGWRVVREVPNPLDRVAPEASAGLVVTDGDRTYWYLLDHTVDGGGASWDPAGSRHPRFEQWLDDMVDLQRGTEPEGYVAFAADGTLTPGVGVRILRQWPDQDLRGLPGFAAPGDRTAVAKVVVDGRVAFVLARQTGGGPTDAIPVDAERLPEPTLAAFLAYARERYASGEGLR
ncbi:hypothetical protein [Nocardioides nitrophenolicus]|uniref:hypothetical protein n=1 Tax=Nocardioides nitrophenolicus TaxID=60489 RepID=UPI00195D73C9|nr:hypothetical protein [Nocardioides nitrophenolicus]MBM7517607.1 hypothetical protein [Nocardioides nitrophenolicus]